MTSLPIIGNITSNANINVKLNASMPPPTTASSLYFSPRLSPGVPQRPVQPRRDRSGSFRDIGLSPNSSFRRNTIDDVRSASMSRIDIHSNRSPTSSPNPSPPFLPNISLSSSCIPPQHDPAVDHAIEAERSRIRELEKEETDMDIDQLKQALKRERSHSCRLVTELATLKSVSVKSQAEAEAHEEGRINCLMRRLECLQREKGRIIVELEREEEMLTNSLQKKLNEVRREKALLEQQIEREHSANSDLRSRLGGRQQQASQEPSCEGGHDTFQK